MNLAIFIVAEYLSGHGSNGRRKGEMNLLVSVLLGSLGRRRR